MTFCSNSIFVLRAAHVRHVAQADVCSICLEEMTVTGDRRYLQCSHQFHGHCIAQWQERSDTCPNCRARIVFIQPRPVSRSQVGQQVGFIPVPAAHQVYRGQAYAVLQDMNNHVDRLRGNINYYVPTVIGYSGAQVASNLSWLGASALLKYFIETGAYAISRENIWVRANGDVIETVPFYAVWLLGRFAYIGAQPFLRKYIGSIRDQQFAHLYSRFAGRELDQNDRRIMSYMQTVFGLATAYWLLIHKKWVMVAGGYIFG